jgi:hypothetical protein
MESTIDAPVPPSERAPQPDSDDRELARLETLLAARTRELRAIQREFERRSHLLREALVRVGTATSNELRSVRDAQANAVSRAVEAEVARAELGFELDELRTQLHASPPSGPVRELRSLYGRVAQLEEAEAALRARLLLTEQDREQLREQARGWERQTHEANERWELQIATEHTRAAAQGIANGAFGTGFVQRGLQLGAETASQATRDRASSQSAGHEALVGERTGLAARLDETERALRSAWTRAANAEQRLLEGQEKSAHTRAVGAELSLQVQAEAARRTELVGNLASAQTESREWRAQLTAAVESQRALHAEIDALQARAGEQLAQHATLDAEVDLLQRRVSEQLVEQSALAKHLAAEKTRAAELEQSFQRERAVFRDRLAQLEHDARTHGEQVRGLLAELGRPLLELEASLVQLAQRPGRSNTQMSSAEADGGESGGPDPAELPEQLRLSQLRCAQLEAALAARPHPTRDEALATLKGELIDTRADATRLSDDLARERHRRRRLSVTARALQAASESGEAPGPWIEELIVILNEGASMPPSQSH